MREKETKKPKPPMAQAAREFLAAMEFPPAPEHGPNPNIPVAGLVSVMLTFANGIEDGTDTVTCSPSQEQIAKQMHCSKKSVSRLLKELTELGLMKTQSRGSTSLMYTLFKTRQQLSNHEPGQQLSTQTRQLDPSDWTTPELRVDNSESRVDNSARLTGQQLSNIGVNLLGKNLLDKKQLGLRPLGGSEEKSVVCSSDDATDELKPELKPTDNLSPKHGLKATSEKLPAGIVRIGGRLMRQEAR